MLIFKLRDLGVFLGDTVPDRMNDLGVISGENRFFHSLGKALLFFGFLFQTDFHPVVAMETLHHFSFQPGRFFGSANQHDFPVFGVGLQFGLR